SYEAYSVCILTIFVIPSAKHERIFKISKSSFQVILDSFVWEFRKNIISYLLSLRQNMICNQLQHIYQLLSKNLWQVFHQVNVVKERF
ncbi:hypothetical protein VB713_11670, partial [Anabaena cylindrica UHCC 0172]|uniref:hypothetical protein n=1 Tax=Anabaena cylindrica TaxID=1165 RepID=UPI002B1FAC1D